MSDKSFLTVELNRRLDVGEVLGAALSAYQRYPLLFVELTLPVVIPYALIVLVVAGGGPLGGTDRSGVSRLLVLLLNSLVVTPLISALHIHALVPISRGETPRARVVFRRGLKVLAVVAAAQVVAAIATAIGFVCLIIPGMFLATRWAVVAQAAATEDVTWLGALRRSYELTRGSFWHVFGVIFIVGVVGAIIGNLGAIALRSSATWLQVILGIAVLTITLSFTALSTAVLFYDLRARRQPAARGD